MMNPSERQLQELFDWYSRNRNRLDPPQRPRPNRVLSDRTEIFDVDVTTDGGSPGDETTQVSFTYEVFDLEGNSLATGVTPETTHTRSPIGRYIAAQIGTAFYDGPTLKLRWVNETPSGEACP